MKSYVVALLSALFLTACSSPAEQACEEVYNFFVADTPRSLTLSLGEEDASRIELMGGKCVWSEGDFVSVFHYSNANQKWSFDGVTGERIGTFSLVEAPTAKREMTSIVALYPYKSNYEINTRSCNVGAMLPEQQYYAEDSFGVGSSIMVACGTTPELLLRNVCGWLCLNIKGSGEKVESIALCGNAQEQIAGRIYIHSNDATSQLASMPADDGEEGGVGGTLIFPGDIVEEVTLLCGGVELGQKATAFYIALPPRSFKQGFTVDIRLDDGRVVRRLATCNITIKRNHILPMQEFSIDDSL